MKVIDVFGYEDVYEVDEAGVIWTKARAVKWGNGGLVNKPRKPLSVRDYKGYLRTTFFKDGKQETVKCHRVVAMAFMPIENPGEMEVNHKDGDKSNNHISNLEWCTRQENANHAKINGLYLTGANHKGIKLSDDDIRNIRASTLTNKELTGIYGVSSSTISNIVSYKTRKNVI